MTAVLIDDFVLIAPDRVLHVDNEFVYSPRPLFVIRADTGQVVSNEFGIPPYRFGSSQIFVWERNGKFKRSIGRDDPVELLSGNKTSLVSVSVLPSPDDPSNLVSVVEVIRKTPAQVTASFVDKTITVYDGMDVDDDWIVLESGNHQDLHFLDIKTTKITSRRTGLFQGVSFLRGYNLVATVAQEYDTRRIDLIDPRRDEIVTSLPLSSGPLIDHGEDERELTTWRRVKIFVLGEENIGKTHFIRTLCGAKYKENISTEGIHVSEDRFGEFTFRFLDFGGQEVFYPTHQFFLTGNAIYVIVFNMASPNWNRVEYWLQMAHQYGERSPVVLTGTHLDHFKAMRFDQAEWEKRISQLRFAKRLVKRSFFVSNLKPETMRDIKPYFASLAHDLPSLKKQIPTQLVRLVPFVERSKMSYAKWTQFATMVGMDPRGDELKLVAHFLHEAGSLLWFKDVHLHPISQQHSPQLARSSYLSSHF